MFFNEFENYCEIKLLLSIFDLWIICVGFFGILLVCLECNVSN